MYFQDKPSASLRSYHQDVALFTNTYLIADTVDCVVAEVSVKGEVINPAVCKSVAIVLSIAQFRNQVQFGESRNRLVYCRTGAQSCECGYESCGYYFVIAGALLDLKWGELVALSYKDA